MCQHGPAQRSRLGPGGVVLQLPEPVEAAREAALQLRCSCYLACSAAPAQACAQALSAGMIDAAGVVPDNAGRRRTDLVRYVISSTWLLTFGNGLPL